MSGTGVSHLGHCTLGVGYKGRPQCPQKLESSAFLPLQFIQTITVLQVFLEAFNIANICGANKNPNPNPKPACTALPVSKKPISLHIIQSDSINAKNKPSI